MRRAVLMVACAVVSGGCKRVEQWADRHAAELPPRPPSRPAPVPTGPGLAPGSYRIVDVRVEAEPTHRGKPWDDPNASGGAAPDLGIRIRVDGAEVGHCTGPENSFVARCRLALDFELDPLTQIELRVVDRDSVVDDVVGDARLVDPSHWGTDLALPMATGDDLHAAAIVLARTPTWWEAFGARVLGALAGLAVGLALVAALRRRLFAPRAPATASPALLEEPILIIAAAAGVAELGLATAVELGGLPHDALAGAYGLATLGLVLATAHVVHGRRVTGRDAGIVLLVASPLALELLARSAKLLVVAAIAVAVLSLA